MRFFDWEYKQEGNIKPIVRRKSSNKVKTKTTTQQQEFIDKIKDLDFKIMGGMR